MMAKLPYSFLWTLLPSVGLNALADLQLAALTLWLIKRLVNTNKIRVQFGKRCWQCCQLQHLSWLPLRCLPSDKCGKRICNLVSSHSPFPEPPPCSAFKSGAFKTNFQFVIKQLRGSCPLPVTGWLQVGRFRKYQNKGINVVLVVHAEHSRS